MALDVQRVVDARYAGQGYELRVDGSLAGFAEYRGHTDTRTFTHTEIDERREGEGLGSVLVRGVLDHLRAGGKTVIPTCGFTAAYIRRHPEYVDLVAPSLRRQFG